MPPSEERAAFRPRPAGDGGPEERCRSCRRLYPQSELDQRLWCPPCRDRVKRLSRIGSHVTALVVTVPFGIWVLVSASTEVLSPMAWLLPLAAAYYLGWRIGREVVKGWVKLRNTDGHGTEESADR